MSGPAEPLRRLARESGRMLGELGVGVDNEAWARKHADVLASLVTRTFPLRLPRILERLWRRLRRATG
jgi:hypothetical protein